MRGKKIIEKINTLKKDRIFNRFNRDNFGKYVLNIPVIPKNLEIERW